MAAQVSYALTVTGNPASSDLLNAVKQIEVEDHSLMADMLRIRLAVAVREDSSGWTLLDDAIFTRLANVKLSVTVGSGAAIPLINAYVIDVGCQFSTEPTRSMLTVVSMAPPGPMPPTERVKPGPRPLNYPTASTLFPPPPFTSRA